MPTPRYRDIQAWKSRPVSRRYTLRALLAATVMLGAPCMQACANTRSNRGLQAVMIYGELLPTHTPQVCYASSETHQTGPCWAASCCLTLWHEHLACTPRLHQRWQCRDELSACPRPMLNPLVHNHSPHCQPQAQTRGACKMVLVVLRWTREIEDAHAKVSDIMTPPNTVLFDEFQKMRHQAAWVRSRMTPTQLQIHAWLRVPHDRAASAAVCRSQSRSHRQASAQQGRARMRQRVLLARLPSRCCHGSSRRLLHGRTSPCCRTRHPLMIRLSPASPQSPAQTGAAVRRPAPRCVRLPHSL